MKIIDLRSDTVTHPTEEMREAMAKAPVGDDVYGEDPTVNKLEQIAAKKMGKEASLFVPSGTMGNLLAVLTQCGRGDEVIMGNRGHTFLFEGGGISTLGGVFAHTLPNQPDGTLLREEILAAIRPDDIHHPVSKMLILENTHNRCGGVVLSTEYTNEISTLVRPKGLFLHLDGARIFNAAARLNKQVSELVSAFDSITFCLSKGLCAPVGSVLCGSKQFIQTARRFRKVLGGGMRQAGILAAAGIIAVEKMPERLKDDHRRAWQIAEGIGSLPGVNMEMGMPQTNMVFPTINPQSGHSATQIAERLAEYGIKVGVVGDRRLRLVTHYWITDEDVDVVINAFRNCITA